MNRYTDRALLIIIATAIVATLLMLNMREKPSDKAEQTTPTIIPTKQASAQEVGDNEQDYELFNEALTVIHRKYGPDTMIRIERVNAAAAYIEISVNSMEHGYGDGTFQELSELFLELCSLDSGRVILSVWDSFVTLVDFRAIEVFRGNRKPQFWAETRDEPWKPNRGNYGAGITTKEDIEFETARVAQILRERGILQ